MPVRAPRICGCGRRLPYGSRCPCQAEQERERRARHDARRPGARTRGYNTRWDKARATYLRSHPLCVWKDDGGRPCGKPATVVDHIQPHRGDQSLFWDESNWQPLCVSCHSSLKQRKEKRSPVADVRAHPFLRPSAIPVTIVCGPAGAGKSTYVRNHAGPNDVVIDLDVIRSRLSGGRIHQLNSSWTAASLDERNRILRSLASDRVHERAWFIVAAPDGRDRDLWKQKLGNARIVLIATPLDECIRRIRNDPTRAGQFDRMEQLARDWWSAFTPGGGQNV